MNKLDQEYQKELNRLNEESSDVEIKLIDIQDKILDLQVKLKAVSKENIPKNKIDEAIGLLTQCGYKVYEN